MARNVVVLLGVPGAGKGTQARAVKERLGIPHISTGDILRDAITRQTPLGVEAKKTIDAGDLVNDLIVTRLVEERIRQSDCLNGFILDGYPRTLPQAEALRGMLRPENDRLCVIEIRFAVANRARRLTSRLTCGTCGEVYNQQSRPPNVLGVCDRCGAALKNRSDDREDVIEGRFRAYQEQTLPVVDFYRKSIGCYGVDGAKAIDEITREILDVLSGHARSGDQEKLA